MLKLLTSDKALHFLYCYFLASIWWPLGIVFAIGKEVYDWFKYGRKLGLIKFLPMTLSDLLADGLGILFACIGGYNG
ncbi:MAG TPA: hypothetical protein VJ869_14315 [Sphaerochaeta sp.]|nr:hypothetical protein [Sphaerochaeta sp.]